MLNSINLRFSRSAALSSSRSPRSSSPPCVAAASEAPRGVRVRKAAAAGAANSKNSENARSTISPPARWPPIRWAGACCWRRACWRWCAGGKSLSEALLVLANEPPARTCRGTGCGLRRVASLRLGRVHSRALDEQAADPSGDAGAVARRAVSPGDAPRFDADGRRSGGCCGRRTGRRRVQGPGQWRAAQFSAPARSRCSPRWPTTTKPRYQHPRWWLARLRRAYREQLAGYCRGRQQRRRR